MRMQRLTAVLLTFVMMLSLITTTTVKGIEAYDGEDQALSALRSVYDSYENGRAIDGSYGNFGGYEAYMLMEAGVDLDLWSIGSESFEDQVRSMVETSSGAPSALSAKRLAQDYAAARALGMTANEASLLDELITRQSTMGTGSFDDSDYSAYSNLPAYDILLRTQGETVTSSALDLNLAIDYVLGAQAADNGWPMGWSDFQSTAQAVRVLSLLDELTDYRNSEIATALAEGKSWLMSAQKDNGSFKAGDYDDVIVDTAEAIYTALVLGQDPDAWVNGSGTSPVDYLLSDEWANLLADSYGNAVSRTWGLDAYTHLGFDIEASSAIAMEVTLAATEISEVEVTSASALVLRLTTQEDITTGAAWSVSVDDVVDLDYLPSVMGIGQGTTVITAEAGGVQDELSIRVNAIEGTLGPDAIRQAYKDFMSGTAVDAGWGNFSGYDLALLIENDVDLSTWVYQGTSMVNKAQDLIAASLADANGDNGYGGYTLSAKRLAQDTYLASALGMTDEVNDLLGLIEARQKSDGSLDGGLYGIYSDYPAYDILLRADLLVESDLDLTALVAHMTNGQDSNGAWPIEDTANWISNDFMTTAQAVRVLKGVRDYTAGYNAVIDSSIEQGLAWLLDQQQEDGSFVAGYDDQVVDAAEMIYTAVVLGEDGDDWQSSQGNSPLDFFSDRNFSTLLGMSAGNIPSVIALLDASNQSGNIVTSSETTTDSSNSSETVKVYISVIGQGGQVLYGPKKVTLDENDTYGLSAMSALDASKLDWSFSDSYDGFVKEIDGQSNAGMSGWMYAVNNTVPSVLSTEKILDDNDKVTWWYSDGSSDGVPDWPSSDSSSSSSSSSSTTTATVLTSEEALAISERLETMATVIEEAADGNLVLLNQGLRMTDAQALLIQDALDLNKVAVSGAFQGEDLVISDDEIQMFVPGNALQKEVSITANEVVASEEPESFGIRLQGAVYEFGPDGANFDEALTISIKVAIDSTTDVDELVPAWYDEDLGVWVPIAGAVDLASGLVTFKVDHFTKFTVLEDSPRISFGDMEEGYDWAVDAVEILAAKGYINGTGTGYEPGRQMTRAEFTKVMTSALAYDIEASDVTEFTDVDSDSIFAAYINAAKTNGLIEGDADGSFRPDDPISRNEVMTIVGRLEADNTPENYTMTFVDASTIPAWAREGVAYGAYKGIIKGNPDGSFSGDSAMTRAEAAVIIYRYLSSKMD